MSSVSEKLLEDEITAHLVAEAATASASSGPIQSGDQSSTRTLGLDTRELFTFIEETQRAEWETPRQGPRR